MKTKVKIALQTEASDTPCWPYINYDYDRKFSEIFEVIKQSNPDIDFDIAKYTSVSDAEADYENDLEKYDGVLVLLMTCGNHIEMMYARKAKDGGLPVIIADIPFCGSGAMLVNASRVVRKENLPVPLISSLDYKDLAKSVQMFSVIKRMRESKILVVADWFDTRVEEESNRIWGCSFVHASSQDFNKYFEKTRISDAEEIAKNWQSEAVSIVEPNFDEIVESARIYLALEQMKKDSGADAVTVDCLSLSYSGSYNGKTHMYPCMSHYEMSKHGTVAVCEADINATVASLIMLYLTGRPGYVSDPVIDTSSNQIIYAHCVACTKIFGHDDKYTCPFYIRSHAEDKLGASVQTIFPAGEKLTTVYFNFPANKASIHSGISVGNVGCEEGCRSKLAASAAAEVLLNNWQFGRWHRVTVFGDYRKLFMDLCKMRGVDVIEEDK